MDTAKELLLRAALRSAADEIVGLWWVGPYAPGKVDVVEAIIRKHVAEVA